jgi:hypothetical protein
LIYAEIKHNKVKFQLIMPKMQKYDGQAQEFDNFFAIASLAPKVIGSTPKLFGSSATVEHVAFGGK